MTDGSKTNIRAPCSQSSAICPLISETKLMYKETENNGTSVEELPAIIRQRAYNLMFTGKMMCSEAVLSVLNQGIGGGLPPDLAIKMTAGLAEGIGGSGCTCGALTGGVISLGLFLSDSASKPAGRSKVMAASGRLHHDFKLRFGSTCCRVLLKNGVPKSGPRFEACCNRGGWAAEQAARMILAERPELSPLANQPFLRRKDSRIVVSLKRYFQLF